MKPDAISEDIRLARDEERYKPWKGRSRLVCPIFNDKDPITWLSRVSQYFDLNDIPKGEKVHYATYYFEGEANRWWQWLSRVYKKGKNK